MTINLINFIKILINFRMKEKIQLKKESAKKEENNSFSEEMKRSK